MIESLSRIFYAAFQVFQRSSRARFAPVEHHGKFGNHVTVHQPTYRPSITGNYKVKKLNQQVWQPKYNSRFNWREIAQPPAFCKAATTKESIIQDENGKRKLFLYPCCLKYLAQINCACHVHKFGIQSKRKTQKKRKQAAASEAQREKGREIKNKGVNFFVGKTI